MKKKLIMLGIALSVALIAYLGFQWFSQSTAGQALEPTLPVIHASSGIIAEGVITPKQNVTLNAASGVVIKEVLVDEGDKVKEGDILILPQNLDELESNVEASRLALINAQKNYDYLISNAPLTRANAQLALITAQQNLEDAQDDTESKQFQRASQETIDIARANLISANDALDNAEDFFNTHNGDPDSLTYATALSNLAKARQNQNNAQWNLDYVKGLPDPLEIEEVDAKLILAQANLISARAEWDDVKDEPNDLATIAARAQVASAQAAYDTAQAALDRAVVYAPFDGTVVSIFVEPGQLVASGTMLLTLANLDELYVETIDLSELDVTHVILGMPAEVTVNGLDDRQFPAQVIQIADQSTKYSGDVVYKVTLRLLETTNELRWGMTTSVRINP